MSGPFVLYQYGDDPLSHRFIDTENRLAFTMSVSCRTCVARNPNPVIRLTREAAWSQQHPSVMGPDNSFFYLGPESSTGYIVYGGGRVHIPMNFFLRPGKRDGSLCQNGRDYKWKIGSHRMECLDGRTILATWEVSSPEKDYHATLVIKPNAMSLITEITTTLILNRMALALGW
ncbi:hypothetical protein CVT25_007437 [Psilocybe cyanescens]|uniref:Uncharacterized protein n=1 Tax=Psilocybe cyanescens TaxID=93625 RepID=A0A409XVL1_PSICY|nr:hypothetical protein CVT25_007437 [Psilocybe cyanescens]